MTFRDITARKQAGAVNDLRAIAERKGELRRSEAFLAEAQRLSLTGSFSWRVMTDEITWSDQLYRIYEDEIGVPVTFELIRTRVHREDLPSFEKMVEVARNGGTDFEHGYRLQMPDESIKYLHTVAHGTRDEDGRLEYIGAVQDVTARRLAFEEIKALKDQLYKENVALREEINETSMFEEIIGSSGALRRVLLEVAKVAPTDSTVLILGETGTGKELIARAIHKRSKRSGRAFIRVNCAAIPASLIASELFGHEGRCRDARVTSRPPMGEPFFWTKSANFHLRRKFLCCGYSKSENFNGSGAANRLLLMYGCSLPRTGTWMLP